MKVLLLCSPKDIADFVNALGIVIKKFRIGSERAIVCQTQNVGVTTTLAGFNRRIATIFSEAAGDPEPD